VSALTTCRSCGAAGLESVLSLGTTPLANSLVRDREEGPEDRYPLELVFCPSCTLVQITETVPPDKLFSDYLYFSSFSDTMLAHARELVTRFATTRSLGPASLAVEVASNDGYLLQYYQARGIPVLGIEPAQNVARVAIEEKKIATIAEFFGLDLARRLSREGHRADILHANNVLAHVADLNGFVAGIREVLKDGGLAALEFPYVGDMVDRLEFDTIYHEHLCYFSVSALMHLFGRHGLKIVGAERVPIHGGSILLQATRVEAPDVAQPSLAKLLAEEKERGLETMAFYRGFARRVWELKDQLTSLVARLKAEGRTIAAYGAAAKGSTLLNVFGIGAETLDFVADRSSYKQGRYMPGVRIPIVAPEHLLESMPDYTLLLTWNFADEILAQQAEYRRRGGKFIVPIPQVNVI
jgi:SAM-dependent methyltransferase